jgi:hypothetical protein
VNQAAEQGVDGLKHFLEYDESAPQALLRPEDGAQPGPSISPVGSFKRNSSSVQRGKGADAPVLQRQASSALERQSSTVSGVPTLQRHPSSSRSVIAPSSPRRQLQRSHSEDTVRATRQPASYHMLRLVEVEAMLLQTKVLVRLCRWREALDSIAQLKASLVLLNLECEAALDDCDMLEALCNAGLGSLSLAEKQLRDVADKMLRLKRQESSMPAPQPGAPVAQGQAAASASWACRHERDRFFVCSKAAGSLREVMQDFVGATADYIECAQTWSLANDLVSQSHPFVAEASFCTARARWRAGLLPDENQLQLELNRLSKKLGAQHPIVSAAELDVSEALAARSKLDEAETLLLRAQKALALSSGRQHPSTARCDFRLACIYQQRGPAGRRYAHVLDMMDRALAVQVARSGRRHVALFPILAAYADVCRSRGGGSAMVDREAVLRRWALRVLVDTHGADSALVDGFREQLIDCLVRNRRVEEARSELHDMLLARETSHGPDHMILCDILLKIVDLELSDGHKRVQEARREVLELEQPLPAPATSEPPPKPAPAADTLDTPPLALLHAGRTKLGSLEKASILPLAWPLPPCCPLPAPCLPLAFPLC